ncbi:MAG: hypothetical protein ACYC3O_07715 [Burkholderiales bacterium]
MKNGDNLPTTTVTQARVCLFQPTQRPVYRRGDWIATSWGRCRVTGRLGQRHADVFESIFFHAEKSRKIDDRLEILVDPARIRKSLSDARYSGAGLQVMLDDLAAALVQIDTENGWVAAGHLIDSHYKSSTQKKIDPLTGEERPLIVVKIGDAAMALLADDIKKWRDPAPIARLERGISQAVARFVLSHRPEGQEWKIDSILDAVGVGTGQERRNRKRELLCDREDLESVGILISGDRIFKPTDKK